MTTPVDEVVQGLEADLAKHGFDHQRANLAVAQLQALPVETEEDRRLTMAGFMRLVDALLPHAPDDTAASLKAQRRQIQARFDQMYGREDSPYAATVRITAKLVEDLKRGGSVVELQERAQAELAALPFDRSEWGETIETDGRYRVMALTLVSEWLLEDKRGADGDDPVEKILEGLDEALRRDGFDKALIFDAAQAVSNFAKDANELFPCLLLVWGMGLWLRPDAAPSIEPLRNSIISVGNQALDEREAEQAGQESPAQTSATPAPPPAPPAPPAPPKGAMAYYDATLREMKELLERDGFSMYAYEQAMVALKGAPIESDEDLASLYDTMLEINDAALPYTKGEDAQALAVMRPAIEKMKELAALDEVPELTADEIRARAEALLREMRQNLADGEFPSVAATRATTNLQLLGLQAGREDEESLRVLTSAGLQVFMALQPHIPEGTDNVFNEAAPLLNSITTAIDLDPDDALGGAVFETRFEEQGSRFQQTAVAQNETQENPNEAAAIPHVRQFAALVPDLWDRLKLIPQSKAGKDEEAEAERLNERLDRSLRAIRNAYSEEQLIRHQRETLRGAVLELRQFERRRHLTLARPAFPTNAITVDPNDVFFSGTDAVAGLVKKACDTIGMSPAAKHGLQNHAHGRWQQLRGSGVAVFDYSAYDPKRADPAGALRRSRKGEERLLGAAGPVATVAYENGWAYALGVPTIVVTRKGQAAPFDVDIEPVLLEEDGDDVERMINAMQTAFYGPQRGLEGDCLAETLEHARRLYGGRKDSHVKKLLSALTDVDDATRVRMALSAVIDRIEGENPLLVFPTFPGGYPSEERRELFHVTAFRDWSEGLQEEARAACERAGVEYRIGYKRLNPDIIRIIWNDICRASFVVADITNLNPNAVMELAMAQAVGRPTLILTRNRQPHTYLPALQKVRTHYYDPDEGRAALSSLLDSFLAGEG